MEETPKEKAGRIRRSLFFLPEALFGKDSERKSKPSTLGKVLTVAAATAAAVTVLTAEVFDKPDDVGGDAPEDSSSLDTIGDAIPDFPPKELEEKVSIPTAEDFNKELSKAVPGKMASPKSESSTPAIQPTEAKLVVTKPDLVEPPPKPVQKESLLDKVKRVVTPNEDSTPYKGRSFEGNLTRKKEKGFRTHQTFTDFKGAKSLSELGSYTDEEANTVRQLKTSGVNTSANAGVLSTDIEERIRFFSEKHDLDPEIALKMAQMESGGNPNAISSTGAIGIYQFTGRTASEIGITNRFDPNQNIEGGIVLAKRSVVKLKSSDLPVTPTNIYLMHQLGVSGARELLVAAKEDRSISSLSGTTQRAISHNFGAATAKTAKDYIAQTAVQLDNRSTADRFASSRSPSSRSSAESAPPVSLAKAQVKPSAVSVTEDVNSKVASKPVPTVISKIDAPDIPPQAKGSPAASKPQAVASRDSDDHEHKPQSFVRTKNGMIVVTS